MSRCRRQVGWVCALCVVLAAAPIATAGAAARGDANCDGNVNADDLSILTAALFSDSRLACAAADVNGDGRVEAADVVSFLEILGEPPLYGPVVTYVGLAGANGVPFNPLGSIDGVPVFFASAGSGFDLVIESRQGRGGIDPGLATFRWDPRDPAQRPDLQIESSNPLGDGGRAVCDGGGVPAVNPPDFGPTQRVADALNDLACNFMPAATAPGSACTVNQFFDDAFVGVGTQVQFCLQVSAALAFPLGDTVLSVQVRDKSGNIGPLQRLIVRVAPGPPPPTFTPTVTPTPVPPTATTQPTPSPTDTPTIQRTGTPTRSATATRTPTALPTATPSHGTATVSPSPESATPSPTPSRAATRTPTRPSPTPTRTATAVPSPTPTASPTATPSPTPSPTLPVGPVITFFGLTKADDTLFPPSGKNPDGLNVFTHQSGSGFRIVVEGKPGPDGASVDPVLLSSYQPDLTSFPDLQIEASNPLGNGSAAVCDRTGLNAGGVPAIWPVNFDPTPANIDIVNDFACRFLDGNYQNIGRTAEGACVQYSDINGQGTGFYGYADPSSKVEFCSLVEAPDQFPPGDTVLTARLRDTGGNVGAPAQIIVHIGP